MLDRQVRLYGNDKDMKKVIIKALKKLFDNGHVQILKDVQSEPQDMIMNEPVQYFIPWLVVFKSSSLSIPARLVFDCSARTPPVVWWYGRKMLVRSHVQGSKHEFEISGDIIQFYNIFKLDSS